MKRETFILDKPGEIDLTVPFAQTGEEIEVLGIIDGKEEGDYSVRVRADHQVPNTFGRITIKGVAQNGARIKIDGMVIVEEGASMTDSFLEMRVLLLDKKSSAIAEPKLEIKNNRVKASHAATVGKINEEELFYLESRGNSIPQARNLIVNGFLKEIRDKINHV